MRTRVRRLVRYAAVIGVAACGGRIAFDAEPTATVTGDAIDGGGASTPPSPSVTPTPPADTGPPPIACAFDGSAWVGSTGCMPGTVYPTACGTFEDDGGFGPDATISSNSARWRRPECEPICADAGFQQSSAPSDVLFDCRAVVMESGGPGVLCVMCSQGGRAPSGLDRGGHVPSSLAYMLAGLAELEAVSVPAFEILRAELAAHGAPNDLLARADRARKDEIRHARTMRRLAKKHGGDPRPPRIGRRCLRSLGAIARENAVEGCVRETFGAMVAQVQAARAADPAIKRAMKRIAIDEASHAELSWDVARFCDDRLDEHARREVREAVAQALTSLRAEIEHEPPAEGRAALGLPSREESRDMLRALERALAA